MTGSQKTSLRGFLLAAQDRDVQGGAADTPTLHPSRPEWLLQTQTAPSCEQDNVGALQVRFSAYRVPIECL